MRQLWQWIKVRGATFIFGVVLVVLGCKAYQHARHDADVALVRSGYAAATSLHDDTLWVGNDWKYPPPVVAVWSNETLKAVYYVPAAASEERRHE